MFLSAPSGGRSSSFPSTHSSEIQIKFLGIMFMDYGLTQGSTWHKGNLRGSASDLRALREPPAHLFQVPLVSTCPCEPALLHYPT